MNNSEKDTVSKMIRLYCRLKHQHKTELCTDCRQLEEYSRNRLEYCPFGEDKPACEKCSVHCYKPDYRKRIREVMRFSGPRMLFYHPVEAVKHFLKKKKQMTSF